MDDPTLAPPPRPPFPAAGAAWLTGAVVYSAVMAAWMAGLTILKENSRLDLYPHFLFDFVIRWYFPLLWGGLAPGVVASFALLYLGWKKRIAEWIALVVPFTLGFAWIGVGWLLIADNLHQLSDGFPFHWPH